MGFKQADLIYPGSSGPTAQSPAGKSEYIRIFQGSRSDTVSVLKTVIPASASIISITFHGGTVSNAATTATYTLTISNNTGAISTGSIDVKTNGATTAAFQMTNLPNLEPLPLLGDLQITAQYAETGTASTSGGPWTMSVRYCS